MAHCLTAEEKKLFEDYSPIDRILTVFSKKDGSDDLLANDLFKEGKRGNSVAAAQLVQSVCSPQYVQSIFDQFNDKPVVFVPMPSTSFQNKIPIELACFMAKNLMKKGVDAKYIQTEEYIHTLHSMMMKSLRTHFHRALAVRIFEEKKENFFDLFRQVAQDRHIVLVEDILTTGSSVNAFRRFIEKHGVQVSGVIGLKGNDNLAPSPTEIIKFAAKLRKVVPDLDAIALGKELTRNELWALRVYVETQIKQNSATKNPECKLKIRQIRDIKKKFLETSKILTLLYRARVKADINAVYSLQKIIEKEVSCGKTKRIAFYKGLGRSSKKDAFGLQRAQRTDIGRKFKYNQKPTQAYRFASKSR